MPNLIYYEMQRPEVQQIVKSDYLNIINNARQKQVKRVSVENQIVEITKPFPSPVDWRDHMIYFLMIDRFNNPYQPPNYPWDQECNLFQGGTIEGVRAKLGYLKSLGAGAIWITPPFKNTNMYHGYGIQDFVSVDPARGTDQDLQGLVDEAHARGLYVIFDIVINHAGDIFGYSINGSCFRKADWQESEYNICNYQGVLPEDLNHVEYFRRQGSYDEKKDITKGDFDLLKEFKTELSQYDEVHGPNYQPVQDILIKICQLLIAKYDVDGFRIDTLQHIERECARIFGNSIREFGLSIGKKNFFTFGEVWADEIKISKYAGRSASDQDDLVGVDASLDFPLYSKLPNVIKGLKGKDTKDTPRELAEMFEYRKNLHRGKIEEHPVLLSSHGELSQFFVTFLDNHDITRLLQYQK